MRKLERNMHLAERVWLAMTRGSKIEKMGELKEATKEIRGLCDW